MRAQEVSIHNFRSIQDVDLRLEDLSLLAGPNNSGKSNVINAIQMFYGKSKWNDELDAPKFETEDDESWVEIEFRPSTTELAQLKDEYCTPGGTFRVRNYVRPSKDDDGKKREGYYAYVDGELSETLFYGAKNVGSGKIGDVVYIPAVGKVDDHTKLTGPSSLRDLVANVLRKVIAGSEAYEELAKAFEVFETDIKAQPSDDGESLSSLAAEISNELESWETSFDFGIQNIKPDDLIKSLVEPQLIDEAHGEKIDPGNFGAGFQRHLIYSLIRLAAKYATPKKAETSAKKEFSPDMVWVLFEEPEAFLHPTQEETLYESLLTIVSDESSQVLLTTHSARFVSRSMDELTRLIRLRRDSAITTRHQVSQKELDELFDASYVADAEISQELGNPDAIDKSKVMSALKLELWIQPQRAAAFFAQWVVLVEGPTEVCLYQYLVRRRLMDPPGAGIVFVDCMGKYNIHRFMRLLNSFGIDHSVLYDGDRGGSKDVKVTSAINDATGAFTHTVTRYDADLETELGIGSKVDSHRKPQYVIYHVEADLIEDERIDKFAEDVRLLCTRETES